MKKSLENKIKKYVESTKFPKAVYYTVSPYNLGGYEGYKYFFCYHGTNNIDQAFKTQRDLEEFIDYNEVEEFYL